VEGQGFVGRLKSFGSSTAHKFRAAAHDSRAIKGAEYAVRFALGVILSGAEIFGGYAPFGVGIVAPQEHGWRVL
jgi:hypothetical protein